MADIINIGPSTVKDVLEQVEKLSDRIQSVVVIAVNKDDSCTVFASRTPLQLEKAAVILMRFAQEHLGNTI